jgi:hypothetical protein
MKKIMSSNFFMDFIYDNDYSSIMYIYFNETFSTLTLNI